MDGVKKVQRGGVLSSRLALIKAWQRHSCLGISEFPICEWIKLTGKVCLRKGERKLSKIYSFSHTRKEKKMK